jgi:hypothetical protein
MATLIAVYNSEGCVGRCDARCYDAEEPRCDCICGGKNHQAGRAQAEDNTRELAESWLDQMTAGGVEIARVDRSLEVQQVDTLFTAAELGRGMTASIGREGAF